MDQKEKGMEETQYLIDQANKTNSLLMKDLRYRLHVSEDTCKTVALISRVLEPEEKICVSQYVDAVQELSTNYSLSGILIRDGSIHIHCNCCNDVDLNMVKLQPFIYTLFSTGFKSLSDIAIA